MRHSTPKAREAGPTPSRKLGHAALDLREPFLTFAFLAELHVSQVNPVAVLHAHLPESAGQQSFLDRIAEDQAIGDAWGVHGGNHGDTTQAREFAEHAGAVLVVVIGNAGKDHFVDELW